MVPLCIYVYLHVYIYIHIYIYLAYVFCANPANILVLKYASKQMLSSCMHHQHIEAI